MGAEKTIGVVGAGWAGLAAAVRLTQAGCKVVLFEASPQPGGRARDVRLTDDRTVDNGQHILIAGYRRTLAVMRSVGVDTQQAFLRVPMTLQDCTGKGLHMPARRLPPALAAAVALWNWRGMRWQNRLAFALAGQRWKALSRRYQSASPPPDQTVEQLCADLPAVLVNRVVEPLCVAALNTPVATASARVFVRVLHDSLWQQGDGGGLASDFLLPRQPLGTVFPLQAVRWLQHNGAQYVAQRVQRIDRVRHAAGASGEDKIGDAGWQAITAQSETQPLPVMDALVLASPVWESVRLVQNSLAMDAETGAETGAEKGIETATGQARAAADMQAWLPAAQTMQHLPIATVYVQAEPDSTGCVLPRPMFFLPVSPDQPETTPAQFVFDRGQIGSGRAGELAFVISDCRQDRRSLEAGVQHQCRQIGLPNTQVLKTVVEKRATFACTAGVQRPEQLITSGLYAAGDWVRGVYPATLEGAVMSGEAAAAAVMRKFGVRADC